MIDIGVNLTNKAFRSDAAAVLQRAREVGVESLVITGTSIGESHAALELAEAHGLVSTAGVHPHDAKTWDAASAETLRELASATRVVAIGECGLDFNRNYSPPADQERAFAAQLELACELGMPVFLHERDAHDAFCRHIEAVRDRLPRAVAHCFTGTRDELRRYLELDLHIGITGWICDERRGQHLIEAVADIPPHRLMIETDAPYLLPRTIRPKPKSRRNEPAFLTEVRDAIARATGRSPEDVARATTETTRAFFGI